MCLSCTRPYLKINTKLYMVYILSSSIWVYMSAFINEEYFKSHLALFLYLLSFPTKINNVLGGFGEF